MTGDIVFEPLSVQGLFINICALYWQRDGNLTIDDINKRYKNPPELANLSDRFIVVSDRQIAINFLDEQLKQAGHISAKNSKNGKIGAQKKARKALLNKEKQATASDRSANLSKVKESKVNKSKDIYIPSEIEFLDFIKENTGNDFNSLSKSAVLKYNSWVKNDWKNGNDKKIKNWKSTILNTIPYLKKEFTPEQKQGKAEQNIAITQQLINNIGK